MDVLFVDVGFGTCNVILTGSGGAIVIDAGKRSKESLNVLHQFSVNHIHHLIVSHWHDDHVGGATGLLRAYSKKIGKVWFPPDPAFRGTQFWDVLLDETAAENIKDEQVEALMIRGASTHTIWASTVHDADLKLVSPCFMEANRGIATGNSNATSGVIVLRVGEKFIVFAGDAVLSQWQQIPNRIATPLQAEVLGVPHHAGIIWPGHWNAAQIATALATLYSKIVKPKVAVISAATQPGTKHPRQDVIEALIRAKSKVMCTQITRRCSPGLEQVRTLRSSLPVLAPGRSSPTPMKTSGGKSCHVACAGSVLVELLSSGATIHQLDMHQKFVDALPNSSTKKPICRP